MAEQKPVPKELRGLNQGSKRNYRPKSEEEKDLAGQFEGKPAEEVEQKAGEGGGQTSGGNFENREELRRQEIEQARKAAEGPPAESR